MGYGNPCAPWPTHWWPLHSPPPCINWPTKVVSTWIEQISGFQGVHNIKAFTYLRYWYHCSVWSQKHMLCVCPEHVSQTNLSLYNPCHSCRICTLCLTCHESAVNWDVTAANPISDKQKLHKAGISTPCLVTSWESNVQTSCKGYLHGISG